MHLDVDFRVRPPGIEWRTGWKPKMGKNLVEKWQMAHGPKWGKNGTDMAQKWDLGSFFYFFVISVPLFPHFKPWAISLFSHLFYPFLDFGPFSILYQVAWIAKIDVLAWNSKTKFRIEFASFLNKPIRSNQAQNYISNIQVENRITGTWDVDIMKMNLRSRFNGCNCPWASGSIAFRCRTGQWAFSASLNFETMGELQVPRGPIDHVALVAPRNWEFNCGRARGWESRSLSYFCFALTLKGWGHYDTIAPLSRGWGPLSGLERGVLPVCGCEIGRDRASQSHSLSQRGPYSGRGAEAEIV